MALFFAVTIFVSATLLFLVQPMVGKMILPLLGGTPAVWSTCMVFFQALLLAGYAYAHASIKRLGVPRQSALHLVMLALPLVAMGLLAAATSAPIAPLRALAPQDSSYPFFGTVALLFVMIGVPFFVVSSSAPLLQRWFSTTGHKDAADPYFLYAASNAGSLLALILYPAVIEPNLRLNQQAWLWAFGYAVLAGLTAICALALRRAPQPLTRLAPERGAAARKSAPPLALPSLVPDYPGPAIPLATRLRWLVLAMVPSSLLLAVTTYTTTDIAPIPLLWIIPLALYLLTFIIAFGRTAGWVAKAVELIAPVFILLLIFSLVTGLKPGFSINIGLHLLAFLAVALVCHLELARLRPEASRLTEFFFWMSLGGVLGGLVNALIAPILATGLTEYPLALIAAALLLPNRDDRRDGQAWALDLLIPLAIAGVLMVLHVLVYGSLFDRQVLGDSRLMTWSRRAVAWMSEMSNVSPWNIKYLIVYGLPALACYYFVDRPMRFGLAVAALWCLGVATADTQGVLYQERSFFGILKVEHETDTYQNADGTDYERVIHKLVHGVTLHGKQLWDPPENEPLTYYHRTGPVGQVFLSLESRPPKELAFVGLGTGSLAAYGRPGMTITYYEIDKAVHRLAHDERYFTYLRDCKARVQFEMGDARIKLEESAHSGQYDLMIVDAFSSDAIPVHLLTREAVQLYADRLKDDGLLLLHISNRYLDLEKVAARIAAELRLVGKVQHDDDKYLSDGPDDYTNRVPGKLGSQWVVLARRPELLEGLAKLPDELEAHGRMVKLSGWRDLKAAPDAPLWTDDFSNLLQIFNWK